MQIEKLTESEEAVMRAIWDCHKEPVLSDVVDQVNGLYGRNWKPQTVSTFLSKLCRKNYIKLQRNGKIYTYKILVSEDVYNQERLKQLYIFLYKNNKEAMRKDLEELQIWKQNETASFFRARKEGYMDEQNMKQEDWKDYLGISEEPEDTVPADDMEGEWEDVRKL